MQVFTDPHIWVIITGNIIMTFSYISRSLVAICLSTNLFTFIATGFDCNLYISYLRLA